MVRQYRPAANQHQSKPDKPCISTAWLADRCQSTQKSSAQVTTSGILADHSCPRIAQQIALAFGVEIDKDVVRPILSAHYQPDPDSQGPSWLTFLGHMKDSLDRKSTRLNSSHLG